MEVKENAHLEYDILKGVARVDEILQMNCSAEDVDSVPSRGCLTYKNGCYVNVSALSIDIVDSSKMTDSAKRPTLAKIYRCFISECIAVLAELDFCQEVNIHGDCVWGVFDTTDRCRFNLLFNTAEKLMSCINMINNRLNKYVHQEIKVGIGCDFGRALMIKAGLEGSGLNDVVWMGDVVNSACHLANKAGRNGLPVMLFSDNIYNRLDNDNQKWLRRVFVGLDNVVYGGNSSDVFMDLLFKMKY